MQVKKFEAPTMSEALQLVKNELGPEAIILSTKNNKKGFGLLSKPSVEVTAAISEKTLSKKKMTERLIGDKFKDELSSLPASKQNEIFNKFGNYLSKRKDENQAKKQNNHFQARYVDIQDDQESHSASINPAGAYARNGRVGENTRSTGENRGAFAGPVHADMQSRRIEMNYDQSDMDSMHGFASQPVQNQAPKIQVKQADLQRAPQASQTQQSDMASLQSEVAKLKELLAEVKSDSVRQVDQHLSELFTDEIQAEYQQLLNNGVERRYAGQLLREISFRLEKHEARSSERVKETLARVIMDSIQIDHPLNFKSTGQSKVIAMIGPTGVGKTTTIAKLASQAILKQNLRVGLINLDFFKIAALDQLSTYAKILNVPFRQATNQTELTRALAEFKPLDLILIDTGGYSQKDTANLLQLKNMVVENPAIRPVLILSATTRDQELSEIVARFKIFNPNGLIFSKLDESTTFGCIYNISRKTNLPLNYFTIGQRVPEDIEESTKERVVDLIVDL